MKKRLLNLLTIMFAAGLLAGCGSDDTAQNDAVENGVTLGKYKGIELTVEPVTVEDSQVESIVSSLYSNAVTADNGGILNRAVAVGDTVNIDYEGRKDDVAFDGGTASGYNLVIGSDSFIDGFEDGLVGVQPGETVDLNLTFPEGYRNEELAGEEVVFTVTVNYIMPEEREDSVVAALGIEGVNTVEELQQYAYDYLYSNAEYNYNLNLENTILSTFIDSCVFGEISQETIGKYESLANDIITEQAESYGMDVDSFVSVAYNTTLEEVMAEYGQEAAKQNIALLAVADQENLNVSDEELAVALQENAAAAGYETVEDYLGGQTEETYREYLLYNKVLEFMIDNAVISNE